MAQNPERKENKRVRARNWVFTWNHPSPADKKLVLALPSPVSYVCYGVESGSRGTVHLQGYIELEKAMSLKYMKELLPKAHLEVRRGNQKQAIDYCKKDGDFHEAGVPKCQGRRTDLIAVRDVFKESASFTDAVETLPRCLSYGKAFQIMAEERLFNNVPDWRDVKVGVLVGETGCGKTRAAVSYSKDYYVLSCGESNIWFDGYKGEDVLILDDFDGSNFNLSFLLRVLDGYKCRLPIKGSFRMALWTKVIITSNIKPEAWYNANPIRQAALKRRIDFVKVFQADERTFDDDGAINFRFPFDLLEEKKEEKDEKDEKDENDSPVLLSTVPPLTDIDGSDVIDDTQEIVFDDIHVIDEDCPGSVLKGLKRKKC